MPIYEYICTECNKDFEYLVLGNDPSITCPECKGDKVKRKMSACSFKTSGDFSSSSSSSSGSGCSGCSATSCSTCH